MKFKLLGFLKNDNGEIIIPSLNIFIVFLFVVLNPFIRIPGLQFWMFAPFILLLINLKFTMNEFSAVRNFTPFVSYITLHFIISIVILGFDPASILKFILFLFTFLSFLVLYSKNIFFIGNSKQFEKIVNAIVLIVGIYGIYQFIGRQLGLPLTFNEILRYRNWKVGGFYQISSFFEEPAFYSQFLIIILYIHLFIFELRYIKTVALIILSILMTISVTGIISMVLVLLLYYFSKIPARILITVSRKKILFISSALLGLFILILVLMNSKVGNYINNRIQTTFVNNTEKQQLIDKQKVKGGSVEYDKSGYARVVDEFKYLKETVVSRNFLFGFGVNYQYKFPNRSMALNAVTEFTLRWGLLGFILFLLPVFFVISKHKASIYSLIFILLYFTIDGAIAKLSFWLLMALFLSSISIKSKEIIKV